MATVTTHTLPLSLFSSGGRLRQGQLKGLALPVDVSSLLLSNLHIQ